LFRQGSWSESEFVLEAAPDIDLDEMAPGAGFVAVVSPQPRRRRAAVVVLSGAAAALAVLAVAASAGGRSALAGPLPPNPEPLGP